MFLITEVLLAGAWAAFIAYVLIRFEREARKVFLRQNRVPIALLFLFSLMGQPALVVIPGALLLAVFFLKTRRDIGNELKTIKSASPSRTWQILLIVLILIPLAFSAWFDLNRETIIGLRFIIQNVQDLFYTLCVVTGISVLLWVHIRFSVEAKTASRVNKASYVILIIMASSMVLTSYSAYALVVMERLSIHSPLRMILTLIFMTPALLYNIFMRAFKSKGKEFDEVIGLRG